MKLYKIISYVTLLAFMFVLGCTDRGVNYGKENYTLVEGGLVPKTGAHVFTDELVFQLQNKFQQMPLKGYMPKVGFPVQNGGDFKPVPLLILLPPQDGDENFYFQHGLKEVADELISKGEIQPMAILCVPNGKLFGGYFFAGSSPAAGFYDSLIGTELIRFVEEEYMIPTLKMTSKRGIGGIGMGAYGAYRAAILNPGVFSSVSGVSGPMDFDGADGASGLMTPFDDALNEQGLMGQNLQDPLTGFSYAGNWHISRLFIGGSFAFSSHQLSVNYEDSVTFNQLSGTQEKEFYFISDVTLDTTVFPESTAISYAGFTNPPNVFKNNINYIFSYHLPFDNNGNPITPVWDLWLQNNLPVMFVANPNAFDNVNLWMGNSSESTFGNYNEQTDSWISTLKNSGVPVSIETYELSGYDGHPANKDQYVYDILREMLIFHSKRFGN